MMGTIVAYLCKVGQKAQFYFQKFLSFIFPILVESVLYQKQIGAIMCQEP